MPGGLSGVEQTFTADASGYISEIQAMIKANQGLVQSVAEAKRAVGDAGKAPGGSGAAEDIAKVNAAIRDQLKVLGDAGTASASFARAQADAARVIRDHGSAVRDTSAALVNFAAGQEEVRAGTVEMAKAQQAAIDAAKAMIDSHLQGSKVLADSGTAARSYATDLGSVRDNAKDATSALADTANAVAAVKSAGSGGGGKDLAAGLADLGRTMNAKVLNDAVANAASAVQDAIQKGLNNPSPNDAFIAAARPSGSPSMYGLPMGTAGVGGPSDGGYAAGGLWPAFAAAAGAAAGGGAAGGGGGGGGRGRWSAAAYGAAGGGADFPDKSAGAQAATIVGFVKRWAGPVHWAMMATNEILATVGPSMAALGTAAMVGWQGVEQMMPRFNAINATAEALGGAYGITSGQYLGTGRALQNAQNLATGGVYELGGAAINLARGSSGAFSQMGLNTIGMIDRGVAGMQINMAQRGTAGQLASILGGGTDYAREFGDVGANIGDIFLGLAPHLPGVGGDYLATLKGATGLLAGGIGGMNQAGLGNVLGLGLAGEAGLRVGTPMVGLLGRGIGGLGGLAEKLGLGSKAMSASRIAELAASSGVDASLIDAGGGGLAGALGGIGTGLGVLGGPEVAALAASAFLGSKLIGSMPSPAERQMAALQAGVNQAGFSAAFQPLGHAITTATGLAATAGGGGPGADMLGASEAPSTFARFGPIGPTARQIYQNAATGFGATMDNLIGAGPQLVTALQKAGLKGVSMGDAFQIAQNSLLDLSHAFDSHGKLTKTSQQMLSNYVSAIGPMTRSGGGFNAAIDAQQIMASPAMQNVSKVNQAMDSMTQIMSGGPAGMAGLFSMLGGAHPAGTTPAAMKAMAQAMTSVTTAGGAAAWTKFAGSSGIVAAEQQNLDQLRTAMTLGAVGPGGAAGLAGFQLQQMLPMAKGSSGALAMLMQQGQQMGIGGYYDPSKSLAQNYAAAEKSIGKIADTSKQANAQTNSMAVNLSRLPQVAQQFSQGFNANIQSQEVAKAATAMTGVIGAAGKGSVSTGGISTLVAQMKQAGLTAQSIGPVIQHALQGAGVGAGMQKKIMLQVGADTAGAQSKINGVHGKNVDINIMTKGAQAAQAAMDAIHGKTVTVTIVEQVIQQVTRAGAAAAGIPAFSMPGGPAGMRIHAQTGGMVPGSGSGDIIPAMLEPGEAIIPRYLVPLIAPILASHRVPGFGGVPQSSASHFAAGGIVPRWPFLSGGGFPDSASQGMGDFFSKFMDALQGALTPMRMGLRSWMLQPASPGSGGGGGGGGGGSSPSGGGPLGVSMPAGAISVPAAVAASAKGIAFTLTGEIAKEVRNSKAAKNIAAALIGKVEQEIQYAKSVSASVTQGLNLGGMDVTPGTGNGTVVEQMQSYLASEQSFSKDLAALRKQHLNKNVISQLVGAGPVQGDALAQSILGGAGGVKATNQLYAQIQKMANSIGAQAAMAQYGGHVSANLKSASATANHISININAGSGGSGNLSLTQAQIKQIVAEVQAALLKQAKRNNQTGVQLAGKGA